VCSGRDFEQRQLPSQAVDVDGVVVAVAHLPRL
jgi:hypothetical protein